MANRTINFFDNASSSTTPTVGNITASDLVKYPDDATFEASESGAPVGGNIYYNTTLDVVRYYSDALPGWVTVVSDNVVDSDFTIQDNGDSTKKMRFEVSSVSTGVTRVYTVPDEDTTLAGTDATQTLTNKTIDADNNTISNLEHGNEVDNPSSGVHGVTGNVVGTTDTQTLTNKTIGDDLDIQGTTSSTDETTGALTVAGGVGVGENLNVGGDLTVEGDLTVNGTTTTVNTENLDVEDENITVNVGGDQATADDAAGLTVEMSDATDVKLLYDKDLASRWKAGDEGSEEEVLTANHQQRITQKDIDLGTASDDDGITVSSNTTANMEALTREAGRVYYSTDEEKYYGDNGSELVELGSGGAGGELNFYELGDAEDVDVGDFATGNNATFDNGGSLAGTFSLSETASDLIRGEVTHKYVQSATAGDNDDDFIASPAFDIPQGYRGRFVKVKTQFRFDGTDDNVKFVIWDVTNSQDLANGSFLVKNYEDSTNNTAKGMETVVFIPADCAQLKFGPQVITGEANVVLTWDDVVVTPNAFQSKNISEHQIYRIRQAGNALTDRDGEWEFNLGTADINNDGASIIVAEDDSGSTRTKFTAQKDCYVDISASAHVSNTGRTVDIMLNGTDDDSVMLGSQTFDSSSRRSIASASIKLSAGDYITFRMHPDAGEDVSNDGNFVYVHFHARAETEHIVHSSTGTENVFSGRFDGSSGASVSVVSESIAGTFSISQVATGRYTLDYSALGLFNAPAIAGAPDADAANGTSFHVEDVTNTQAIIETQNAGTLQNRDFGVILMVQGSDYKNPQAYAITPITETVYLKDVKSAGTDGGTFTQGAWQTRDLNTLEGDTNWISLSSNQFTLYPGKYEIEAEAPATQVNNHQSLLYNITDSNNDIIGSSADVTSSNVTTVSIIKGQLILNEPKTFEIRHRCVTTNSGNGFGTSSNFGVNEVYTQVKITRIRPL